MRLYTLLLRLKGPCHLHTNGVQMKGLCFLSINVLMKFQSEPSSLRNLQKPSLCSYYAAFYRRHSIHIVTLIMRHSTNLRHPSNVISQRAGWLWHSGRVTGLFMESFRRHWLTLVELIRRHFLFRCTLILKILG